jgi:hypothetical protein
VSVSSRRISEINTFAEIVAVWATALLRGRPGFSCGRRPDGELVASVEAPAGAASGRLVVLTEKGNLWVRFAPPHLFYSVESRGELSSIVKGLLGERLVFVVAHRGGTWRGTTLIRRGARPHVRRGEVATIVSWSGRHDRTATYADVGRPVT